MEHRQKEETKGAYKKYIQLMKSQSQNLKRILQRVYDRIE